MSTSSASSWAGAASPPAAPEARRGLRLDLIGPRQAVDPMVLREIQAFLASAAVAAGVGNVSADHDVRWLAVLRESLGHRPYLILARVEGRIEGYLPLALVASRLFGRFLVSLPYLNESGVVARDAETARALIGRAADLAGELDVRYLELRHREAVEHSALGARRDGKVRMVLELPADADALWKGLDAKVRNQVRKGDKSGLTLAWGGAGMLDDFYRVFAVNMRDLGTPVYPRGLFASILSHLGGSAELAVTYFEGRAVAGALLVHAAEGAGSAGNAAKSAGSAGNAANAVTAERGGTTVNKEETGDSPSSFHALAAFPVLAALSTTAVPSASALRAYAHTNANMWMYHRLLLRAMERGSRRFDFGRSSVDSGTFRFKKQWGALAQATVWQYHVRQGDIDAVRPESPRYRRRIQIWQKLPVWVTRLVGPRIIRGVP